MLRFKEIRLVIFDFDGVFTDNNVYVSETGEETVLCSRADGIGIDILRNLDIPFYVISSEINKVVTIRCEKLGIPCKQGVLKKINALEELVKKHKIRYSEVAYLGNDINDLECMQKVGYPVAVNNAVKEIKDVAVHTTDSSGGKGAVREFCELFNTCY